MKKQLLFILSILGVQSAIVAYMTAHDVWLMGAALLLNTYFAAMTFHLGLPEPKQ